MTMGLDMLFYNNLVAALGGPVLASFVAMLFVITLAMMLHPGFGTSAALLTFIVLIGVMVFAGNIGTLSSSIFIILIVVGVSMLIAKLLLR